MAYVNVGVKTADNREYPTKAALKQAVATNPERVLVYSTSYITEIIQTFVPKLSTSDKYSVTGPNPYNSRKWYATLAFNAKTNKWVVS